MMSHFAEINENNIVLRVLVGNDDEPNEGLDWLVENLGGTWIKTSYNTYGGVHTNGGTPLNKNYAGIGYSWDGTGFAPEQCHLEATFNSNTYLWDCSNPEHIREI